jgi:hypothetical protein
MGRYRDRHFHGRKGNVQAQRGRWRRRSPWHGPRPPQKPKFKLNIFFISLVLAIGTFFLAFYVHKGIFIFLEVLAWIYFSYYIYRGVFRWVNRINLGNDLAFFGLKALAVIIILVGFYVGFAVLLSFVLVKNFTSLGVILSILLLGLMVLCGFILFRTNRRHQVIGVWRA